MRVAAVQYRATKGNHEGSLRALRELADEAAIGSDLVVLPEMAATGYLFATRADVELVAEPADGRTLAALAPVAREHGTWIVVGFPELAGEVLFNSALVIAPDGSLRFTYRKTLLYDADAHWARSGDSGYARIDTDAGSFGVGICMDLNDDRFTSWCSRASLDVVALPTCWIDEADAVWPYWLARMVRVPGALVAADAWGTDGGVSFAGQSAILQRGRVLAGTSRTGDAIVRATIPR
ncbi:MAG: putative amidohydrolase [Myxococcota bacterium]